MTKLFLFAGHIYGSGKGVDDFKGQFISIDDILEWLRNNPEKIHNESYVYNWAQIVDANTMKEIVYYNNYGDDKGWHIDND